MMIYIEIFIGKNTEVNNLLWNESKIRWSNGLKQGRVAEYNEVVKQKYKCYWYNLSSTHPGIHCKVLLALLHVWKMSL